MFEILAVFTRCWLIGVPEYAISSFELVATSMISVLEESKRRANEMHYVLCRICFLLDRRESKTRWNDRIQKCGEKTLNYTYFLYRNRRKWAKLRLHNRQFNAHDVKRVCKKVSDAITNVSVVSEGINIMAIRACVFWWTPKIMLELQPCFFININDLAIPLFAVCYFLVLFKRAESLRLHFWCFIKDAFPHIFHSQMK